VAACGIALSEADIDALDRLATHREMIPGSTRAISQTRPQDRAGSH
jgi:hypothetical protein